MTLKRLREKFTFEFEEFQKGNGISVEDRLARAEGYINQARIIPTCDYCGYDVNMWIIPPPKEEQNYKNCGNIISCSCCNCMDKWFEDKDKRSDFESVIYPECDSCGKRPITGVAIARDHEKHGYIKCVCFECKPKMKKFY